MRKLFLFFVALLATSTLWAYDFQSGDLYYNITSSVETYTVEVTYEIYWSCDNYSNLKDVVIPEKVTHDNITYLVTGIGQYAFCSPCSPSSSQISSIVIPNSVTSIGDDAFNGCSSLTSIIVKEGNTTYDSRNDCNAIIETATNTLIAGCQNTIIPNSVTSIGNGAFKGCFSLTSVTIPNSVTSIGEDAFSGCSSLTSVTIPNSVTSIGEDTFYNCSSLTSVTIPNSVTSIGGSAFYNCSSLSSITIPNSVTSIGERAFYGCTSLTSPVFNVHCFAYMPASYTGAYTIPEGIKQIAGGAFEYCSSLTSVTIPKGVTSIESSTFHRCSSLTSVTIPNSVTSIGTHAFSWSPSLTSVTIPNSVTSIEDYAFYQTSIYNTKSNWENGVLYISNCLIEAERDISGSYAIKEDTRILADDAFFGCSSLTSVTIPNSVTSIGWGAFYDCVFSKDNFINNSTLNAEENNYWGAELVDIDIDGLLIRNNTIVYCRSFVTSVIIPNSVTSIGEDAFSGCSALKSIYCKALTPPELSISSFPTDAYDNATLHMPFESYADYIEHSIWGTFKNIQYIDTFYNNDICYQYILGKELLSKTLTAEDDFNAFTNISITGTQTWHYSDQYGAKMSGYSDADSRTYSNEDWLISPAMDLSNYSSATLTFSHAFGPRSSIPTTDAQKAQYTCWVSNDFNGDVTTASWTELPISYGTSAWNYISTVVDIPTENLKENCCVAWKYVCENSSATWEIKSINVSGNYLRPNVKVIALSNKYSNDIIIPSIATNNYVDYKVTTIAASAFSNCSSLTSISIPNSVTTIGSEAFSGCTSLESITIPNSITSLSNNVFTNCTSLNEVTLPASITSIGENAFAGCTKLYDIYCYAMEPPTAYDSSFANYNAFLHVPCDNQRVYLLDVLFGNFKYIECIEAETATTDTVVVDPSFNDAEFTWPSNNDADTYTLAISKDGEVFCTLTFNANGQLTGIAFAPSRNGQHNAPAAVQAANGFTFTVTGLDEGSIYTYDLVIKDSEDNTLQSYSGEFRTQSVDDRIIMVEYDAMQGKVIGAGTYLLGDTVMLTATPSEGYQFVTWGDGNTDNPRTLVVTQDTTLTALFEVLTYNVTVTCDPIHGSVTGSGTYNHGDVATLTAIPNEGYQFVAWGDGNTDNPRALVVTQDTILTALFDVPTYNITVTCDPIHGYVTGSGTYNHGDVATLTATPSEGYTFVEWGDGCTDNPRALMVTQDTTLTAIFEILTYNVTVTYDPIHGSVTGSGTYNHGDVVTLTAIPNEGYQFVRWSNEVEDNPYTFVISDNVKLSAEFEAVIHSSVENTHSPSPISSCQKIFRNGQLLILRDGKTYNVMGQEM